MSRVIDARGLACPQPVLLTKKAIAEENRVTAIVDGETARQNVTRMAEKQGCRVQAEEREDGIYLSITREGEAAEQARIAPGTLPAGGPLVVSVASEFMGRGDDVLGNILIRAFFHTLGEVEPRPDVLVFYNSGVKLAVEGSPVLEDLRDLEEGGGPAPDLRDLPGTLRTEGQGGRGRGFQHVFDRRDPARRREGGERMSPGNPEEPIRLTQLTTAAG